MPRHTIQVHDDVYQQIYAIKGPGRSMEDAIMDLLKAVFPSKDEDSDQEILQTGDLCPDCGCELREDDQGFYCPDRSCGWEEE